MIFLARATLVGALAGAALVGCTTITEELPARPSEIVNPTPDFNPAPNPSPTSTPAPNQPTPKPDPPPNPNSGTVVKVYIKVFQVACNGVKVPNSEFASSVKVGCQIYFDATCKDAANKPTTPDGTLNWSYQPMSLVKNVNEIDPFAPIVTGAAPGTLSVHATVDGVQSQTLHIQLHN